MSDTQKLIGTILGDDVKKDAIHIAVLPVVAQERLKPGARVGFVDGTNHVGSTLESDVFGIIDPFLQRDVRAGEKCFVFLLPNTVTGMRHEWEHPLVKDPEPKRVDSELKAKYIKVLKDFADEHYLNYDEMMRDFSLGQTHTQNGGMSAQNAVDDDDALKQKIYMAIEIVLGVEMRDISYGPFSCSC